MEQEEIASYSSNDLIHWKYEGLLCEAKQGCGGGRPHMLYNDKSKKYVLWTDNGFIGYQVSTSSSPSRGFVKSSKRGALDPAHLGWKPADLAIAAVNDTGYVVYSMLDLMYKNAGSLWPPINQSLFISPLNDDFSASDLKGRPIRTPVFDLIDNEAESPDLFFRNGLYYVSASTTCGNCNGSIGLMYRSKSIDGPWTRQIVAGDSCRGQVEGVLHVKDPVTGDTKFLWHSTSVPGGPRIAWGGHIFSELRFNPDGSVQNLDCSPEASFKIQVAKPAIAAAPQGKIISATDGSPSIANYAAVCDSDAFTLYQSWPASKSGTLEEVSINIARAYQQTPLSLTVFRFSTYEDLVKPNYLYGKIGSKIILPRSADLSFAFKTINISGLNASVQAGEMLGISISGSDFSPYCHLEYDVNAFPGGLKGQEPGKLFVQGLGQNSWRGLDGKTSVVYERAGKGVKFFAKIS